MKKHNAGNETIHDQRRREIKRARRVRRKARRDAVVTAKLAPLLATIRKLERRLAEPVVTTQPEAPTNAEG